MGVLKPERLAGILSLSGPERYRHFIKYVVDREKAWGLYLEGWALTGIDTELDLFPLWPESDFAALCATREWEGFVPESIPLHELTDILVPQLLRDEVGVAVFPTPDDRGVVPSLEELITDLAREQERYL